jgi:hypothetical protein
MTHPIDIFRMEPTGVRWLEASRSLEDAKARVKELAEKSPGEFVVLDQKTGSQVVINSDGLVNASDSDPSSLENAQEG